MSFGFEEAYGVFNYAMETGNEGNPATPNRAHPDGECPFRLTVIRHYG